MLVTNVCEGVMYSRYFFNEFDNCEPTFVLRRFNFGISILGTDLQHLYNT